MATVLRRIAGDYHSTAVQDATQKAFRDVDKKIDTLLPSMSKGALLYVNGSPSITFAAATPQTIKHGLSKGGSSDAVQWLIVRDFGANKNQVIETSQDGSNITFSSAVACTVYIWVF